MSNNQKVFSILMKMFTYISTCFTFLCLGSLIFYVAYNGIPMLKLSMFSLNYTSDNLSMLPSIINTFTIIGLTLIISVPIGVSTAIYLIEYRQKGSKIVKIVRITTETLQGIPSIIYGLFGYIFFVNFLGIGYSILSGILTMSIMVLPLIIRSTEEALIATDNSLREASYSLGARKLRTIFRIILPSAINGIVSGIILAIGRIFGETAALIFTSGSYPQIASPSETGSSLAIFMWNLASEGYHSKEAYAVAFVLLVIVIIINSVSSIIAKRIGVKNG